MPRCLWSLHIFKRKILKSFHPLTLIGQKLLTLSFKSEIGDVPSGCVISAQPITIRNFFLWLFEKKTRQAKSQGNIDLGILK